MEGTESAALVVSSANEKALKQSINNNDFNKAIVLLGLFNDKIIKDLDIEENYITEFKGKMLHSLAKMLMPNQVLNEEEQKLAENFHIEKDLEKAKNCYYDSLMCGYAKSAHKLFSIYYNAQDYTKAYQMAAVGVNLFDIKSNYNVGKLFYEGKGVKKNYQTARQFFEISFTESGKLGGYELGMMYERGWSVSVNQSKAMEYFISAAECGDNLANLKMGAILSGFYKDKYMEIQKRPKEAAEYYNEYLRKCKPHKRTNALTSLGKLLSKSNKPEEKTDGIKKLVREAKRGDEYAIDYLQHSTSYGKVDDAPKSFDLSALEL